MGRWKSTKKLKKATTRSRRVEKEMVEEEGEDLTTCVLILCNELISQLRLRFISLLLLTTVLLFLISIIYSYLPLQQVYILHNNIVQWNVGAS